LKELFKGRPILVWHENHIVLIPQFGQFSCSTMVLVILSLFLGLHGFS
jgi:hypothetical protein